MESPKLKKMSKGPLISKLTHCGQLLPQWNTIDNRLLLLLDERSFNNISLSCCSVVLTSKIPSLHFILHDLQLLGN